MYVVFDGKPKTLDPYAWEAVRVVEMTNMCQALGCLPRAGGLLDQDAYHVEAMKVVLSCQNERQNIEQKRQEARLKDASRGS